MGLTQIHLTAVYSMAVVVVVALTFVSGDEVVLQNREESLGAERLKRPFCNAFRGCGKKRSEESGIKRGYEPMWTLVDSEPAVEELSKQFRSEAKLSEAIQEARAEMERQRQEWFYKNLPLVRALSELRRKRAASLNDQTSVNLETQQYKQQ